MSQFLTQNLLKETPEAIRKRHFNSHTKNILCLADIFQNVEVGTVTVLWVFISVPTTAHRKEAFSCSTIRIKEGASRSNVMGPLNSPQEVKESPGDQMFSKTGITAKVKLKLKCFSLTRGCQGGISMDQILGTARCGG